MSVDGDALARDAEQAVTDAYGADNPHMASVIDFSGRDAPRVTVATSLADSPSNEEEAMGICRTVISVSSAIEGMTGVYVTAGQDGPHLAECDVF